MIRQLSPAASARRVSRLGTALTSAMVLLLPHLGVCADSDSAEGHATDDGPVFEAVIGTFPQQNRAADPGDSPAVSARRPAGFYDLGGECAAGGDSRPSQVPKDDGLDGLRAYVLRDCTNAFHWYRLADEYWHAGRMPEAVNVLNEMYGRGLWIRERDWDQWRYFTARATPGPGGIVSLTGSPLQAILDAPVFRASPMGQVMRAGKDKLRALSLRAAELLAAVPEHRRPPAIYVRDDACPFEGCQFGSWVAREAVVLLDAPEGMRAVAQVRPGDSMRALTGKVYAEPVPILETLATQGRTPHESLYWALDYVGEGEYHVWADGEVKEAGVPEIDLCTKWYVRCDGIYATSRTLRDRRHDWWVQLRTADDQIGWVLVRGQFNGTDALAGAGDGSSGSGLSPDPSVVDQ